MLVIIATVIARSFARDTHRKIPAAVVAATEARWQSAIADAWPIPREIESTTANQGLAQVRP